MTPLLLALLLAAGCDVPRDAHGRIARSRSAVEAFKRTHPAPPECQRERCVVDHVTPLCACGEDAPENMAWMRAPEARVKDALEVAVCRRGVSLAR